MIKPTAVFDIMIIYDAHLAHSAADSTYLETTPFAKKSVYYNCNAAYQYFIQYCTHLGLRAAFTTTGDINIAGQFNSVWLYTNKWKRYNNIARTKVIFDKFSNLLPHNRAVYKLLTSVKKPLPLFHNQAMRILFDDKLETFLHFPDYSIPTVKIKTLTKTAFIKARATLKALCKKHPYRNDFTSTLVIKDQFGFGGNNIYKITHEDDFYKILFITSTTFVLQPLIQASGFTIGEYTGNTDLRVILFNDKIIQSYLRIAKAGDFRANAQQGGKIMYLKLKQIPADVLKMTKGITKLLPVKTAFYALDFIKSNNGNLYFIEGNNRPGLNWYDNEDKKRAKQLIRLLVKDLQQLI